MYICYECFLTPHLLKSVWSFLKPEQTYNNIMQKLMYRYTNKSILARNNYTQKVIYERFPISYDKESA